MKIAVYTIALNEQQFVERWEHCSREADYRLIADTGSTDRTVATASLLGINVVPICISPWRFDSARNAALALLPADIDVCVSLDMDEVLEPGWRKAIEAQWDLKVQKKGIHNYWWSEKLSFRYDHIHARKGVVWKGACHEAIEGDNGVCPPVGSIDLTILHKPDPTKSRSSYLGLLQMAHAEDEDDVRVAFYLGREYCFHARWLDAIICLSQVATIPGDLQGHAFRYAAKAAVAIGQIDTAKRWLAQAASLLPHTREPLLEAAELEFYHGDKGECERLIREALRFRSQVAHFMNDPNCYGATPHDLLSCVLEGFGKKAEALQHAREALRLDPTNERIQGNVNRLKS